ncbi:hypothetical protein TRV_07605, partial [Trichophyton verrucosum HKI 0517]
NLLRYCALGFSERQRVGNPLRRIEGGGGLVYDSSIEVDEADERAGEADDDDDDDDEGLWITGPRDLAAFEIPETTEAYLPLVA